MLFMVVGEAANGFCSGTADLWQFVGMILLVFKIVIPIILIVLGMIDLGKAVISSDDKSINKAAKALAMRVIAGMLIFFIPSVISFVFTLVSAFNTDLKSDYDVCKNCITNPKGCTVAD
ncbi:MAG: hypothetical protein RSF67_06885 [Clostridia bacterium]